MASWRVGDAPVESEWLGTVFNPGSSVGVARGPWTGPGQPSASRAKVRRERTYQLPTCRCHGMRISTSSSVVTFFTAGTRVTDRSTRPGILSDNQVRVRDGPASVFPLESYQTA